jgi:predicted nucleic acid-binding protein
MQFFDTSVLVSAFVEDEQCHEACSEIVAGADDGVVFTHALAECFSILTGGRLSVRLLPQLAARMIETNIVERMKIVTLTAKETMRVISDCHQLGVRGGGVYDCLHIAAARKIGADQLLTLNLRHFTAFAPDLAAKIRQP